MKQRHQSVQDVTTIVVEGVADEEPLAALARRVMKELSAGRTVIVDIDGLVLGNVTALRRFVAAVASPTTVGRVVFSASRLTARQLLRRFGGRELAIVSSPEEARGQLRSGLAVL